MAEEEGALIISDLPERFTPHCQRDKSGGEYGAGADCTSPAMRSVPSVKREGFRHITRI